MFVLFLRVLCITKQSCCDSDWLLTTSFVWSQYILVNEKFAWEANVISSHPMTEHAYASQKLIILRFTLCNTFYLTMTDLVKWDVFYSWKQNYLFGGTVLLDVAFDCISLCFSVSQMSGLTRTWRCTSVLSSSRSSLQLLLSLSSSYVASANHKVCTTYG